MLDADEFLFANSYENPVSNLNQSPEAILAYAITVQNFVPLQGFNDKVIDCFIELDFAVLTKPRHEFDLPLYLAQLRKNEVLLQQIETHQKLLLRNSHNTFITSGNHQLPFGDGKE